MPYTRNPNGKNQYGDIAKADDAGLVAALNAYHHENCSNNEKISKRLLAEHSITMSATTVKRRRKELGLTGSGVTTREMLPQVSEQLVLNKMDKDPGKRHGVRTIRQKIAHEDGVQLTRARVSEVMHIHDRDAFDLREPTAKKIMRFPKFPLGPHERWAGDGHDKLYKIGFPLWAMVDDSTAKILGAWIVPSNRLGEIIAYLFLCLVEEYGGIPLQSSTDCGSETTRLFGLQNALRSIFYPGYDVQELPAHVYLRSIRNISVERSWFRLRMDWGDNVVIFFQRGIDEGKYDPQDPDQYELCQWLWPLFLRCDVQDWKDFRNGAPMRKIKEKPGPSGMSRNEAFSMPESWGGANQLLPVDVEVIREIKREMGGDALLDFVSDEFAARAQAAYDTLNIGKLTIENIWDVFTALFPLVFPE